MSSERAKLKWSTEEYVKLQPGDLLPQPAPTPEQRIRVAAAVATSVRDASMMGLESWANMETIRAILVEDDAAWARDVEDINAALGLAGSYDPVDPKIRWEQTAGRRFA